MKENTTDLQQQDTSGTVRQEQQQQQSNRFLTRGKQTNRVSVLRGFGLGSSISLSSHEQRKVVIDEHKNSGPAQTDFYLPSGLVSSFGQ
ncbi:hypothetical protein OUZ56_000269 [Daphnia magna]|uniref:Uncharacterized protein n=1 Tax=Daphnia magna TaxID=35525 RepID=A0ABQ9ZZ57_9CRUS|nr:hypothetical protein OUZ56_000269 [Daphnia magna]